MTPEEAERRLARLPDILDQEVERALDQTAADLLETAYRLSSGPFTSKHLRQLGHPYAPGRRPPLFPSIVNVQSGDFRSGWRIERDREVLRVVNDTPEADFLRTGTRRMIARPIEAAIEDETAPRAEARLDAAIERAIRRGG